MTIIILLILLVGLHNSCKDFKVPQCDCYGTDVLEVNRHVHGILSELKKTLFFRIFKVALDEKCLFWNAQKFCVKPSCAVCPCEDGDVPQKWRDEADFLRVNRKTSIGFLPWTEDDEMWIVSPNDEKSVYIDLAANPHEDTGYGGESAHKVWKAIYGENCLHESGFEDSCTEDQFFYRIVSGLHASVSAHIAEKTNIGKSTKPDFKRFQRSLGRHNERVENLHFVYVLMVRAISKARMAIREFPYDSGDESEFSNTKKLVDDLLTSPGFFKLNKTFNEKKLFSGNFFDPRIDKFKLVFRKISLILDCVECEKCQLYGKLQVLGLGTALKIMFAKDDKECIYSSFFQRNELTALLMTLNEFSEAIEITRKFREKEAHYFLVGAIFTTTILVLIAFFAYCACKRKKS